MDVAYHELLDLEDKAEKGLILIYKALDIIHKKELWKDRYNNWADYLNKRWGYSLDYYLKLANAYKVNANLKKVISNDGEIKTNGLKSPKNERQARELASLTPSQQEQVWEKVKEECSPNDITAKKIREVKLSIFQPSKKSEDKKSSISDRMTANAVLIVDEPIDCPTHISENPVKIIEVIIEAAKRFGVDKSFMNWLSELLKVNKDSTRGKKINNKIMNKPVMSTNSLRHDGQYIRPSQSK